ncbi:MAG: hypothetical protein E7317_04855, partial [Clostridiales bacterium]|nr:hypothetical protein [Clostridiales bacterium]
MQIKSKYTWLKHMDFMIVDLVALILSFSISYAMKFGKWDFWREETWTRYIVIISLLDLVISFIVSPYSGILRRSYYQEIIEALRLAVYNFIFAALFFYLFKIGDRYSREVTLILYVIYFVLSLVLKYLWKQLLLSGKVVIYNTKHIPLFIIGSRESIKKTINNVMAGDFQLYDIKGVHFIDDESVQTSIAVNDDGSSLPVVGNNYIDFILSNNVAEVLITVTPGMVQTSVYEKLTSNGIGLNIVVEKAIGFQPEDQYIQNFGVYKTLSIGSFSFTPGQMFYLLLKRAFDIVCGIIGLVLLIPISIIVKLTYVLSGDTAPIFYRQTRVGQNGKIIRIWKFRSMVPNA